MAESKYITQMQENGKVLISEEVLVSIISYAVQEVEHVCLSGKPGKNWGRGVKITMFEDNELDVVCFINVDYNQSVVSAAQAVQEAVVTALESMAGVTVSGVNVNVCGISRN